MIPTQIRRQSSIRRHSLPAMTWGLVLAIAASAHGQTFHRPGDDSPLPSQASEQSVLFGEVNADAFPPMLISPSVDVPLVAPEQLDAPWTLQLMPDGLMFRSYVASLREPRFRSLWIYESDRGWVWDSALGGRVGILRYGTEGALWPEGWQLDIEGAAFPRLDPEEERDLEAVDFRFGIPLTYAFDRYQFKLAYYHLSSHVGDEFFIKNPGFARRNYVRDVIVLGAGYFPHPDWRVYAEAGWAFFTAGGAEPWEFQAGIEYSPAAATGLRGAPFLAINGDFREELDFGGGLSIAGGWQWRGDQTDHVFRAGLQYYNGPSYQLEFLREHEEYVGFGIWYDY